MAKAKNTAADLATALVDDPASPPATVIVGGYAGKSAFDGHERLYLTPDLASYIDIPGDDALHRAPVPGDPLGAVHVWIRRGAPVLQNGQRPVDTDVEPATDDPSDDD